jgi:starvation-inducible DNA-binding protein
MSQALKTLLADTYALYLKTQNYHWNVEGSDFFALHAAFEEQYEDLAEAVDEIAECIRMRGEKVDANFSSFDKLKTLENANMHHDAKSMLKDLHKDHVALNKFLHQALSEIGDDEGASSLISDRISWHEKQIWMLAASLK